MNLGAKRVTADTLGSQPPWTQTTQERGGLHGVENREGGGLLTSGKTKPTSSLEWRGGGGHEASRVE